jgi:hypothetical protein
MAIPCRSVVRARSSPRAPNSCFPHECVGQRPSDLNSIAKAISTLRRVSRIMSLLVNKWYASGVGRSISKDPIGFVGGDATLNR